MGLLKRNDKEAIERLMEEVEDNYGKEHFIHALKLLEDAWTLLPKPKFIYDESFHIADYMIHLYLILEDQEKAKSWGVIIQECDPERGDFGEKEFILGKIFFESGEVLSAEKLFNIAFDKSGGRIFTGEDSKYLESIR